MIGEQLKSSQPNLSPRPDIPLCKWVHWICEEERTMTDNPLTLRLLRNSQSLSLSNPFSSSHFFLPLKCRLSVRRSLPPSTIFSCRSFSPAHSSSFLSPFTSPSPLLSSPLDSRASKMNTNRPWKRVRVREGQAVNGLNDHRGIGWLPASLKAIT